MPLRRRPSRPTIYGVRYSATPATIVATALAAVFMSSTRVPNARADAEHADRVHVRGAARLDVHASRIAQKLVLRGTLTDDSAIRLAGQTLALSLLDGTDAHRPVLPFTVNGPNACSSGRDERGGLYPIDASGAALVPTDEAGGFCLEVVVPIDRYVARVAWRGSPWLDGAALDLPVDLTRRQVLLSFVPEPDDRRGRRECGRIRD